MTQIQGPRSVHVQYEPSLCHKCNSTGSQPYDVAYDKFIDWLYANEQDILRKRYIDFERVYGADFEEGQRNLFKYFVKSFGCRLCDADQPVPEDLIALLPKDSFRTGLKINFCVNEDIVNLMPPSDRDGFIGKGDLIVHQSKSRPEVLNGYTWNEHISWFTICYWYLLFPDGNRGSTWIADSQYVYIGSAAPLPAKMRSDVLKRLENSARANESLKEPQ